ncbi:MAG: hypothetical protein ACOCWG_02390 [bacterium]
MGGLFWGIFIIIIGVLIIIKVVFHIDFPIGKLLLGFFFIYLGIRIIIGGNLFKKNTHTGNDVIFGETSFNKVDDNLEYNVIFSKGNFDFSSVDLKNQPVEIKINTVFGSSHIKLPKNTPYRIKVDAVFSGSRLPNGNSISFGSTFYESENFNVDSGYINIKADVVFGGIEFDYD